MGTVLDLSQIRRLPDFSPNFRYHAAPSELFLRPVGMICAHWATLVSCRIPVNHNCSSPNFDNLLTNISRESHRLLAMSTSPAAENTNTRDWAASSRRKRQKTRELEELLVPGWGTYDLNFNTFNNPGAESLRSFIWKLDQTARWANTRSQYTANLRAEFQRGGLDLIIALYRDPSKVVEDVITFDNTEDLTRHLKMQFSRPLLFQSTTTRSISHPKVSWNTFWAFYAGEPSEVG
ncbi:hypothetical protein BDV35DRAFT_142992 [Aspergillus flavus]|uniref:Uncharacterized protein n=1 Tax=Aspergillus flavus TaxID=5059 RepID=A0A5N6GCG1_ASPFL|nr:hypothetical protein BDV35DRAFT_142992 [Aspergillus flavus]